MNADESAKAGKTEVISLCPKEHTKLCYEWMVMGGGDGAQRQGNAGSRSDARILYQHPLEKNVHEYAVCSASVKTEEKDANR